MSVLRQVSLFALLTMIVGVVPFVTAAVYAVRPTEHHLSLMRPMSLAGLFAAITSGGVGFINVLRFAWTHQLNAETYRLMAIGTAESLVPLVVGFGSLSAAWLLVAVGMGRQDARL